MNAELHHLVMFTLTLLSFSCLQGHIESYRNIPSSLDGMLFSVVIQCLSVNLTRWCSSGMQTTTPPRTLSEGRRAFGGVLLWVKAIECSHGSYRPVLDDSTEHETRDDEASDTINEDMVEVATPSESSDFLKQGQGNEGEAANAKEGEITEVFHDVSERAQKGGNPQAARNHPG